MSIKIICAVSQNGIIGKNNDLPWDKKKYPQDLRFFFEMTKGASVIMGRSTYESIGSKPLPRRNNFVITRQELDGVKCYPKLKTAIKYASMHEEGEQPKDVWLIGGASIFRDGMAYADEIYITLIPEVVDGEGLVAMPWIDPSKFEVAEYITLSPELRVARYKRI